MKKYVFIIVIVAVILSCNTKKTDKEISNTDTTSTKITADSAIIKDSHYFWSSDLDIKQGLILTRIRPASADSLTAPIIIQMLNETYPDIKLRLNKVSHDSIFVNIGNGKYLTQQMGSSGPEAYFAEATYNLTEISGINFVDFNFKEGDHAAPATYSRTDFVQVKF